MLIIKKAQKKDAFKIKKLTNAGIKDAYHKVYNQESISYLTNNYHSLRNIFNDIKNNQIYILYKKNQIIATGTTQKNYIKRLIVIKKMQKKGYGKYIMQYLENKIFENHYNIVKLDALQTAKDFFVKLKYKTISQKLWVVKSGKDFK